MAVYKLNIELRGIASIADCSDGNNTITQAAKVLTDDTKKYVSFCKIVDAPMVIMQSSRIDYGMYRLIASRVEAIEGIIALKKGADIYGDINVNKDVDAMIYASFIDDIDDVISNFRSEGLLEEYILKGKDLMGVRKNLFMSMRDYSLKTLMGHVDTPIYVTKKEFLNFRDSEMSQLITTANGDMFNSGVMPVEEDGTWVPYYHHAFYKGGAMKSRLFLLRDIKSEGDVYSIVPINEEEAAETIEAYKAS